MKASSVLADTTNLEWGGAGAWDVTPYKTVSSRSGKKNAACPSQTRSVMKMRHVLEDQGFSKDTARHAAVNCKTEVGQAVQYALDYQEQAPALYDSEEDSCTAGWGSPSCCHRPSSKLSDDDLAPISNKQLLKHLMAQGFQKDDAEKAARRCNTVESAINYIFDGESLSSKADNRRFECSMCMDDDVCREDILTLGCNHRFCRDCLKFYVKLKLKEKNVSEEDLCCPERGCNVSIDVHIIESLLSSEQYQEFLDLKLRKIYANETREARECPKCSYIMLIEEHDDEMLDCTVCPNESCGHKFCGRCGQQPHVKQKDLDLSCEQYAKFLKENDEGLKKFHEFIEKEGLMQCPKCRRVGELKSGCKFIYCPYKANYCYLCGRELAENMHYSHYPNGPYADKCFGGRIDKKGRQAEPRCRDCTGHDCKKCAGLLQKQIQADTEAYEKQLKLIEERKARGNLWVRFKKRFAKK